MILPEPQLSSVLSGRKNSTCSKFVRGNKGGDAGQTTGRRPGTYRYLTAVSNELMLVAMLAAVVVGLRPPTPQKCPRPNPYDL